MQEIVKINYLKNTLTLTL